MWAGVSAPRIVCSVLRLADQDTIRQMTYCEAAAIPTHVPDRLAQSAAKPEPVVPGLAAPLYEWLSPAAY